jgi:hypothetical protein
MADYLNYIYGANGEGLRINLIEITGNQCLVRDCNIKAFQKWLRSYKSRQQINRLEGELSYEQLLIFSPFKLSGKIFCRKGVSEGEAY